MNEDLLKPKNNPFADARTPLEMDAKIKELDLWGPEFDQYMSPLALAIAHGIDEATMNVVVNVGVTVDKVELLKALKYDRGQFAAGFKAGKRAAQPKWISVEERLPGDPDDVVGEVVEILIEKGGNILCVEVGFYDHQEKHWVVYDGLYTPDVLDGCYGVVRKWKPLPEAPKEG